MKLEFDISGQDITGEGDLLTPAKTITVTQTEEDEVEVSLMNLKSEFIMPARIRIFWNENGWHLDVSSGGNEVARIVMPATGLDELEDRR